MAEVAATLLVQTQSPWRAERETLPKNDCFDPSPPLEAESSCCQKQLSRLLQRLTRDDFNRNLLKSFPNFKDRDSLQKQMSRHLAPVQKGKGRPSKTTVQILAPVQKGAENILAIRCPDPQPPIKRGGKSSQVSCRNVEVKRTTFARRPSQALDQILRPLRNEKKRF